MDRSGLQPSADVLIESAGSGVSSAAVQIARVAGARRVIATAGGEAKRRRLEALGVDLALDYRVEDVRRRVQEATGSRGVDLVVAHVGGPTFVPSLACLAPGGRLVTCGARPGRSCSSICGSCSCAN